MRLKDQNALITGASRGIGRQIALAFAGEGAHVAVTARTLECLRSLRTEVEALGTRCSILAVDMAQPGSVDRICDAFSLGLTRSLAMEVAKDGITVNAICPGATHTVASDRRVAYDAERLRKSLAEVEATATPLGRRLEPEEIAPLAVFLASQEAFAITGQALNVDGGALMS